MMNRHIALIVLALPLGAVSLLAQPAAATCPPHGIVKFWLMDWRDQVGVEHETSVELMCRHTVSSTPLVLTILRLFEVS